MSFSRVCVLLFFFFFFFSSRRRHTRSLCDWSSDVCSSDLYIFYSMHCRIFCKLRPTLSRSFLLLSKTVCRAGCDWLRWPTFTSTPTPRHRHVIKIMNRCQRHSQRRHYLMSLNCKKPSKLSSLLKFAIDEFYSYFENLTVQYQLRQHSNTRNQNTRNF